MFQFGQRHVECVVGVAYVISLGEVNRYDKRIARFGHFVQALVLVAGSFHDIFYTEFLADAVDTEDIQLFTSFKHLGEALNGIPGVEGEIFLRFIALRFIPLSVNVRLADQRNQSHQRTRIRISAGAFLQ